MMAGVQQQEDVGPEPDVGLGRPADEVEEVPVVGRGEAEAGHGMAHTEIRGGRHQLL